LRVQITERHCEVPADTRERAELQVAALQKYDPRASAAEVLFMEERVDRIVEVIVHIDGSERVVARAEDTEFRTALDKVLDRLGRQLKREHELRTDHQAPPRRDRAGHG
jgi:ribosomal subunit interface protein